MGCFRYLDKKSMQEAEELTAYEHSLLMNAYNLRQLDKERDYHWQAYLNMAVQATEERGKKSYPKYPTFEKFFNYEKMQERLFGIKKEKEDKHKEIKNLILIANRKGG